MTEALHSFMNGPNAGIAMLALRALFFVLFIIVAAVAASGGHHRRHGAGPASLVVALALAAIFACQVSWQIFGARNPDLLRFIRRHNMRASVDVRRGSILDRNGAVLAMDDPSSDTGRRYPLGPAAAHVVGYFDARYGMAGVEKAADDTLTGVGTTPLEDLARLGRGLVETQPVEGKDVHLTIDARLQRKCHELLGGRSGAVAVLEPSSGDILALCSAPSFDPSDPSPRSTSSKDAPFLNRATQGRYPAGSTFKVAMASLATELGITPKLNCPGDGFRAAPGAQPIRDVEYYSYKREGKVWPGFGKIGLKSALAHSSNVYFAQLAQRIPPEEFNGFVGRCGLSERIPLFGQEGQEVGVPLAAGAIPHVAKGDAKARSQLAIGQGAMAIAPLHAAMWTSVVAGGGVLRIPHIDLGRETERRRVVSDASARAVADMMRSAVADGTGRNADVPGAGVCGKTGTAQTGSGADHSWFVCFTSATRPRIVVSVIVEHGGFGSRAALPVARGVIEEAMRLGVIQPLAQGGGR